MASPPRVPWYLVLAVVVAGVAVFEQSMRRRARQEQPRERPAPQKPLPPPAPTFEALAPPRGSSFAPGTPIEHRWTALPGVEDYQLDFAHPTADARCAFDAPRAVRGGMATLSHDGGSPCVVWRVRAGPGLFAGSSYSVGEGPGCTLPPSALLGCLEGTPPADRQAPPPAQ